MPTKPCLISKGTLVVVTMLQIIGRMAAFLNLAVIYDETQKYLTNFKMQSPLQVICFSFFLFYSFLFFFFFLSFFFFFLFLFFLFWFFFLVVLAKTYNPFASYAHPSIVRDHANLHEIGSHILMVADRYPWISPSCGFDIAATGRKNVILYLKTPIQLRVLLYRIFLSLLITHDSCIRLIKLWFV